MPARRRIEAHFRASVQLVPGLSRTLPWRHLAIGGALAAAIVWFGTDPGGGAGSAVTVLRFAAVPLVVGLAFAFDDPVEADQAGAALPLPARRALRVTLVLTGLAALWAGSLAIASLSIDERAANALPLGDLTVEVVALTAVVLAVAAAVTRRGARRSGGLAAAPALLAVVAGLLLLPTDWTMYPPYVPPPGDGVAPGEAWLAWVEAHRRWTVLGGLAAVVLVWASRDPARRGLRAVVHAEERRGVGAPTGRDPGVPASPQEDEIT